MRRPDNSLPANIGFVAGAPRSGKSHVIKQRIAKARRKAVLVWDYKNEYHDVPGFRCTYDKAEFVRWAREAGPIRIAFCGPAADFEFFCQVVWARADCLCVVEEIAGVTRQGKAAGTWHKISTLGRGFGIECIAAAQRPAEVDKTIIGCVSWIHTRRLNYEDDRDVMRKLLGVPLADVAALTGHHSIERNMETGEVANSMRKPIPAPKPRAKRR